MSFYQTAPLLFCTCEIDLTHSVGLCISFFLKFKQSCFEFDIDCDHSSNPFRFWVTGKMCMNIFSVFSFDNDAEEIGARMKLQW